MPHLVVRIRTAALFAVASLAFPMIAQSAAVSPPGVNLRWDQCYGDGGAWNKSFACDTNTGSDRMIASFELAADMPELVTGVEVSVDLASATNPIPAWWQFKNAGTCRAASLFANPTIPPGSTNCVDWADAQAAGGIGSYQVGAFGGQNSARIVMAFAVPFNALATLYAGQEYFAFQVGFNHAKTVGTGSCSGCTDPVVIFLSAIKVTTPVASADMQMNRGANWTGSQYVSWQSGYPINIVHACGLHFLDKCGLPYTTFNVVPYDVTNARPSTWGQVKSLYR